MVVIEDIIRFVEDQTGADKVDENTDIREYVGF